MTKIEAARRRRPSDELLSCILTGEPVLIAVVVKGKWRKWSRFFGFSISDQCMEVASGVRSQLALLALQLESFVATLGSLIFLANGTFRKTCTLALNVTSILVQEISGQLSGKLRLYGQLIYWFLCKDFELCCYARHLNR